jgi:hypothetical protein
LGQNKRQKLRSELREIAKSGIMQFEKLPCSNKKNSDRVGTSFRMFAAFCGAADGIIAVRHLFMSKP